MIGLLPAFSDFDVNEIKTPKIEMQTQSEVYHLALPESGSFSSVDIPKKNFIIKKGGIADIGTLHGVYVIVKEEKNNGKVILARKDGKHFFNAFPVIHADLEEALAAGELVKK